MKLSSDEKRFAEDVIALAANHIVDGWGEPLKDVDFRDIDNDRADHIIEHCARLIRAVTERLGE